MPEQFPPSSKENRISLASRISYTFFVKIKEAMRRQGASAPSALHGSALFVPPAPSPAIHTASLFSCRIFLFARLSPCSPTFHPHLKTTFSDI